LQQGVEDADGSGHRKEGYGDDIGYTMAPEEAATGGLDPALHAHADTDFELDKAVRTWSDFLKVKVVD
jgi:hypothetical protein